MKKAISILFVFVSMLALNSISSSYVEAVNLIQVHQASDVEGDNVLNAIAFPNPLIINSIISYDLMRNSNVKLNLYDCQGRLVKKLLDEVQEAGSQQYFLDRASLQSGIYFLNIRTDFQVVSISIAVVD